LAWGFPRSRGRGGVLAVIQSGWGQSREGQAVVKVIQSELYVGGFLKQSAEVERGRAVKRYGVLER